jgi:hypothetical protein
MSSHNFELQFYIESVAVLTTNLTSFFIRIIHIAKDEFNNNAIDRTLIVDLIEGEANTDL